MGSCLQNIKTGRGWLWSVKQLGLALIRGKRLEQNLAKFCTQCSKWAHHFTRCTTNVHQCAPTVGIINSHDDRVHSNLGQMPRSNLLRMIPKKRMSIESFWVLNCKLLRLLLKSCGAAIPYQLCSSTLTIGRLRYNKPQPSVTPAIPAANPVQRFT